MNTMAEPRPLYGSNIPEGKRELLEVALDLEAAGLVVEANRIREIIAVYLTRRAPVRRAEPKPGSRVTAEQVRKVRELAERYPSQSYHQLSVWTGVNTGRISEILAGLRGDDGKVITR